MYYNYLRVKLDNSVTSETYSVIRSNGIHDDNWTIATFSHLSPLVEGPCAWKDPDAGWRIFMHNDKEGYADYAAGWRRLDTIWPKNLEGPEVIKWRTSFTEKLEALETERHKVLEANRPAET